MNTLETTPQPTPPVTVPPPAPLGAIDPLIVSGEDAQKIHDHIINPPEPNEALRELMKGYRKFAQ